MNTITKVILGIIVITLVIWGLSSLQSTKDESDKGPIKIGAIISMTGDAASFGEFAKKGMDLAAEEINAKGGINGRKVEVIIEDDQTDPKQAVSAYQKLVSVDNVQALLGGLFDFVAQPIFPLALKDKIVFISPNNLRIAGSFELNEQSFVMLTDFSTVIRKLTSVVSEDSVKKLAIVHFKSDFGQEIADTLGKVMTEIGKQPVIDESYNQIGGNDFKTMVLKLKQNNVDTVFLDMLDADSVQFLQRSRELGFKPRVITHTLITDAFKNPGLDKTLLENVIALDWELSTPEFTSVFKKRYNIEPAKSADKAYDAVYVLARAVAETEDKSQVANYLESNTFKTINGNIKFNSNHTVDNVLVKVKLIKDGKLVDYVN